MRHDGIVGLCARADHGTRLRKFSSPPDRRVFEAVLRKSAIVKDDRSATGLHDLEAVQRLQTSPVLMALFDIPWTPLFLLGIFIFHPWLGFLALGGGAVLVMIAIFNQTTTNPHK